MPVSPEASESEPWSSKLAADGERRLEAWLLLPESDRTELLGGRIVYKAMPSIEHGSAAGSVFAQLDRFQGPPADGDGGWWLSQDVDLFLAGQGLRPDVVGWRTDRNPHPPRKVNVGQRHLGVYVTAPDWVCEVLSNSTRLRDEEDGLKWQAYHEAGVGHYWIVDLAREQVTVYQRREIAYEPIDVAGREAIKALPPFETAQFQAKRVFLLARMMRTNP